MERSYIQRGKGSHDALLEAANFIQTIEKRRGLKIACLEKIAFITQEPLKVLAEKLVSSVDGEYLKNIGMD